MSSFTEQHKMALVSCIEMVLMMRGNANYHLIVARLNSLYNCSILDCCDHPDYLLTVLKEVYPEEYDSILDEIRSHLDELANEKDVTEFFRVMEN
ncbi:MAG: hypothetical protein EPO62_01935 [Candidatus Nitrosotenuis sp.]|nr:MAG: hypothetical protein EPO62_01935 [Candidatus Nitrosotenuis sp.]